jgi:hypothetical protein
VKDGGCFAFARSVCSVLSLDSSFAAFLFCSQMQHKGAALPDAGRLVQLLCSMPHTPKVAEALKLIRP